MLPTDVYTAQDESFWWSRVWPCVRQRVARLAELFMRRKNRRGSKERMLKMYDAIVQFLVSVE